MYRYVLSNYWMFAEEWQNTFSRKIEDSNLLKTAQFRHFCQALKKPMRWVVTLCGTVTSKN